MNIKREYDQLNDYDQMILGDIIKSANLERSNQFYPVSTTRRGFYARFVKRLLDIFIATIALIISAPINLIIGIITFFDVGRPVFFKQTRMGKNAKPFIMVKFRNMTNEKDKNGVFLRADLRVTKWGHFVRATSLDELLNFINVFKGDMSIIGPRPLPMVYKGRFNSYHEIRHSVKPGLDCPLRDPKLMMTWANRLNNDAWYAQNVTFRNDLRLVYLLFREMLFGKDKQARSRGFGEGTFMGYNENGCVMDSNHIPDKYWEELERTR